MLEFGAPLLNQFYADGVGSPAGRMGERGFNITFAGARKPAGGARGGARV